MRPSQGRTMPLDHEQGLPTQDPRRSDENFGVNSETEEFVKFDRQIKTLDKSLQGFINAMRPIGSSDDLILSASSLRTCFVDLHSGFRRNAARLFPELELLDAVKETPWRGAHPLSRRRANPSPDAVMTPTILGNLLNKCAQQLIWLLQLLNEFPEFHDDIMNTSSLNFYDDLRYWASCLLDYGVVRNPSSIVGIPQDEQYRPIDRHINHLPSEMGDYLTELNAALIMFVDVGVPAVRTAQDRATTRLQNLSTVATFLSAVTGATLQYSYAVKSTSLDLGVNVLWLASLVFSLASAINSQLSYNWYSATYRRPHLYLPVWIRVWMVHTPLLFLVTSAFTFSVGLVCFSFSAFNGTFVPKVVLACTSLAFVALLSVGGWFVGEKYGSSRRQHLQGPEAVDYLTVTRGSWMSRLRPSTLWDFKLRSVLRRDNLRGPQNIDYEDTAGVIHDSGHDPLASFPSLFDHVSHQESLAGEPPHEIRHDALPLRAIRRLPIRPLPRLPIPTQQTDAVGNPRGKGSRYWSHNRVVSVHNDDENHLLQVLDWRRGPMGAGRPRQPLGPRPRTINTARRDITRDPVQPLPWPVSALPTIAPPSLRIYRAAPSPIPVIRSVTPSRTHTPSSPGMQSLLGDSAQGSEIPSSPSVLGSDSVTGSLRLLRRVQILKPQLSSSISVASTFTVAFDPKGRYLSSSDPSDPRTIVIWKMGPSSSEVHQKLLHPIAHLRSWGFRTWDKVELVVWSHSGDLLLTQSSAVIAVWDPDTGGTLMELDPKRMRSGPFSISSEAIAVARWMPNDQAVVFAISAEVHIVSLSGTSVWSHHFQNLSVCDLTINDLENAQMLLVIGRVGSPGSVGLKPSRSRAENRILVVDVKTKAVESLVPNFHTMTSITLAPSGRQVLVGYDGEDVPSELFDLHGNMLQLSRKYTFEDGPDQFKGPTAFGRIHTDVVQNYELAFGRSRDRLHIWDHQSGKLLHTLPLLSQNWIPSSRLRDTVAWTSGGETAIAIAIASEDGIIEVWTTPNPDIPSRDPSTFNGTVSGSDESERTLVARTLPLIGE